MTSADPAAPTTAALLPGNTAVESVTIHPLVLLSVVDHYKRSAAGTKRRVAGVLLGTKHQGKVDCISSFAVPFEEDSKNSKVWYLDHNYLESMFGMCRKINAKEKIVGFYSTGPKIRNNDLSISDLFKRFVKDPVMVIVDVRPECTVIPTSAYLAVEELETDGNAIQQNFIHLPSEIGAFEAEEVGVEHLLRDINDPTVSSLSSQVSQKITGLTTLYSKLTEVLEYLDLVESGAKKPNQEILYKIQSMMNLMPNFNVESLVQSLLVKNNDMHMVIYLSSLIRSVIALHDLVSNKIKYRAEDGLFDDVKKDTAAAVTATTAATKADKK